MRFCKLLHAVLCFMASILFLHSYSQAQEFKKVKISGRLANDYNGAINLNYHVSMNAPRFYQTVVKDGEFEFLVDFMEPTASLLSLPFPSHSEYLYIDSTSMEIIIRLDSADLGNTGMVKLDLLKVTGSKSHQVYQEFIKAYNEILSSTEPEINKSILLFTILDSLVKIYPGSNIITQALFFSELLSYHQAITIHNQLSIEQQTRSGVNGIEKLLQRLKKTEFGSKVVFKDFKSENGMPVNLERLPGRIILLDFWASWCKPCRAKHPGMAKLFSEFKSKGFNIVSISLDTDSVKWVKSIREDQIIWMNVADLKGFKGFTANYYHLNFIPYNLVVDKNYRIIGKNISIEELRNLLLGEL
jgi:thiol-disulfide isomerase/thioredoxin